MELEVWHIVTLAGVWIASSAVKELVSLRREKLQVQSAARVAAINADNPDAAVDALVRLEAYERAIQESTKNQEAAVNAEDELEEDVIHVGEDVYRPVLSLGDFK